MNKFLLGLVAVVSSLFFNCGVANAKVIGASSNTMDFGIVAGSFAGKPIKVVANGITYHVIAADLIEPACNSTQIIVWIEDGNLEGPDGGITYNLGVQAGALVSATADGKELKIVYSVNDVDDCSTSTKQTINLKYNGNGDPLEVR